MLTKGAIGNLVNRYKAVLKKCNLINTFGSLAVAAMLVMGGAGVAGATTGDFTYTAPDKIYINPGNLVSSSSKNDTFTNEQNITIEHTSTFAIEFNTDASIITDGNIKLTSAEGLSLGEKDSYETYTNTIQGQNISISGRLDNHNILNINASQDFNLSDSHLCGDGTFKFTAGGNISLSGDKKPVINTSGMIDVKAGGNLTFTGTTIDPSKFDDDDEGEVGWISGRTVAIHTGDSTLSATAIQDLTITGDVLFFNNTNLNLEAENGDVKITGVVSNRPEAVADEDYVKNEHISCGGNSTISGKNVTINGDVWNERSHDEPGTVMDIYATEKLTINGNVDNQSVLNLTAGSLELSKGYFNFDAYNFINVTGTDEGGTPVAVIGDGSIAPIIAGGNLSISTPNGTLVINGGKSDTELENADEIISRDKVAIGVGTINFDATEQTISAKNLEINGDIVAMDQASVALEAEKGSIKGDILTYGDSAKVTMDGAFTMDGAIAENSKVVIDSGSLTLAVDANTLGTVGNASAVTKGIYSSLTVNSGASLILDLASLKTNGGLFEYTQEQFDAAKKALFGSDDKGELQFFNATLVGDMGEEDPLLKITHWQNGKSWTLSSGEAKGNYFGGGLADENTKAVSHDNASLTISGGKLIGELNGGGTAIGEGTTSHVGNVTINVTGGIITNMTDHPDGEIYTPIRGGGAAMDGGKVTVDKAVLNFSGGDIVNWNENSAAGEGGWTDIMGGGVVIGDGNDGSSSTTNEAVITIGKGFDLRGVGVYGGGDGDTVNKTTVTIADATSFNQHNGFEVFGGGMAADGYNSQVGTATINIGGDRNVITGTKEQRGAIYGGGKAKNGFTAKVDKVTINVTGGDLSMHDIYAGGLAVVDGDIKGNTVTGTATINVADAIVGNIYGFGREVDSSAHYDKLDERVRAVDTVNVTITGKTDVLGNIDLYGTNTSSTVTVDTNDFRLEGQLIGRGSSSTLNIGEKVVDFLDSKFTGFDKMTVAGTTTMLKADESGVGAFNSKNMTSDLVLGGKGELVANVDGITHSLTVTDSTTLNAQSIKLAGNGKLHVEDDSTLKTTFMSAFGNEFKDFVESIASLKFVDNFDVDGKLVLTDLAEYTTSQYAEFKEKLLGTTDTGLGVKGFTLLSGVLKADENGVLTLGESIDTDLKKLGDVKADTVTVTTDISIAGDVIAQSNENSHGKVTVGENGTAKFDKKENGQASKVGTIELAHQNSKAKVHANVETDEIIGLSGAIITVGDASTAGSLATKKARLNGAHMFLDPVYNGGTIVDASKAALIFENSEVDGLLTVGENSVLGLGTTSTADAEAAFEASKLTWGGTAGTITAALYIKEAQTLKSDSTGAALGGIKVDGIVSGDPAGTLTGSLATAGNADFAANSLLMVEGTASSNGNVALTGTGAGTLTVNADAKLYIHNAKVDTYTITDKFADGTDKWVEKNIVLNPTVKVSETVRDGGKISVTTELADIRATFPTIVAGNNINAMHDGDENAAGVQFLAKALEPDTAPADVQGVLDDVARGAVTAGVQNTTLRISDAASNTVLDHMSLAQHDGSRAIHSDGVDFWAAPMYGNLYTSGMVSSGSSVRGQFGGLALGADMEAASVLGGKLRVGAAINGGGGQSESKGSAMHTQNDYGFGGLNLYAGWNCGAFNVIGSVGYSFGDHDIEMGEASMGNPKGNVDTQAITADLRAEYQLKTGWLDILPHVGVRYTALKTDSHSLKLDGSTVNSLASDTQHIMQFPMGVTLSKDFELAGWNVKPMADVSFIPASGDKDTEGKVRFSGVNASDSFSARVMDSSSWAATVGVQAEKGDFSLGLNYGVQASSHETDQNIQLKLGWKF